MSEVRSVIEDNVWLRELNNEYSAELHRTTDDLERLACLDEDERGLRRRRRDSWTSCTPGRRVSARGRGISNRRKYSSFWGWLFSR